MAPAICPDQAPVPPPSYHRTMATALHLDALTLVTRLQLLPLCQLAQRQCPPPLPAGPGGAPRIYSEESLLLLALLRTLWRLSSQEVHDWLCAWPALARACGLPQGVDGRPRVPSKAQQSKRLRAAGALGSEMLFVLLVRAGLWMGLTRARPDPRQCPDPGLAPHRPRCGHRPCARSSSPSVAVGLSGAHPAVPRHRPPAPLLPLHS
jgi:hypothetical protein